MAIKSRLIHGSLNGQAFEGIFFSNCGSPVFGGIELPKEFFCRELRGFSRIWFVNPRRLAKFAAEVLLFPVKNGRALIV